MWASSSLPSSLELLTPHTYANDRVDSSARRIYPWEHVSQKIVLNQVGIKTLLSLKTDKHKNLFSDQLASFLNLSKKSMHAKCYLWWVLMMVVGGVNKLISIFELIKIPFCTKVLMWNWYWLWRMDGQQECGNHDRVLDVADFFSLLSSSIFLQVG